MAKRAPFQGHSISDWHRTRAEVGQSCEHGERQTLSFFHAVGFLDGLTDPLPKCCYVESALAFAAQKLGDRKRGKNGEPALLHAVRVANALPTVLKIHSCETSVTALLHDILEDTDTDYDEIAESFGEHTADHVVLLTKPQFYPKPLRDEIYESGLLTAPEEVLHVKLADFYDNLQTRRTLKRMRRTWKSARRFVEAISGRVLRPETHVAMGIVWDLLDDLKRHEDELAVLEHVVPAEHDARAIA